MRIFTYIPEIEHLDEIISHLNRELPEPEFEIIHETQSSDLLGNLDAYDYDAVIVYNGSGSDDLLKALSSKHLKGPLLCINGSKDPDIMFNAISAGALTSLDLDQIAHPGLVQKMLQNAVLTRQGVSRVEIFGPLEIDFGKLTIFVDKQPVHFSDMQYRFIEYLILNADKFVSKEAIYNHLYDEDSDTKIKTLDVILSHIRKALNKAKPGLGDIIESSHGQGLMFNPKPFSKTGYIKQFGELEIDLTRQEIRINGKKVDVAVSEFMVLKLMAMKYPETANVDDLIDEANRFKNKSPRTYVAGLRGLENLMKSLVSKLGKKESKFKTLIHKNHAKEYILNFEEIDDKSFRLLTDEIRHGPLLLHKKLQILKFDKNIISLAPREYELMQHFMESYPDSMQTKDLAFKVYGSEKKTDAVNPNLQSLKKKLRDANGGVEFIQFRKGVGHFLNIQDERTLNKALSHMSFISVGPFEVNETLQKIEYKPFEGARSIEISLPNRQYRLFVALLKSYPHALALEEASEHVYGETGKENILLKDVRKLMQKNISLALGDAGIGFRRIGDDMLRLDMPIEQIPQDILKNSKISQVPPWAINQTLNMLMFDGDPIQTNETEFAMMEDLISSYPTPIKTKDMYRRHFNGNKVSFHGAMRLFRAKLEKDYNIDQPVLEEIYKGHIGGYVLKINHQELSQDQRNALGIIDLDGVKYDPNLAKITDGDRQSSLNVAQNYFLQKLVEADRPLDIPALKSLSDSEGHNWGEDYIYQSVETDLKAKLARFDIRYSDNKRSGYFLERNLDKVLQTSDYLEVGPYKINNTLLQLKVEGKTIDLAPFEHRILTIMAENAHRRMQVDEVISRSKNIDGLVNSLHTFNLARHNIHTNLKHTGLKNYKIFHNRRGIGYCLEAFQDAIDAPSPTEPVSYNI